MSLIVVSSRKVPRGVGAQIPPGSLSAGKRGQVPPPRSIALRLGDLSHTARIWAWVLGRLTPSLLPSGYGRKPPPTERVFWRECESGHVPILPGKSEPTTGGSAWGPPLTDLALTPHSRRRVKRPRREVLGWRELGPVTTRADRYLRSRSGFGGVIWIQLRRSARVNKMLQTCATDDDPVGRSVRTAGAI
jgi:hypothetical protein